MILERMFSLATSKTARTLYVAGAVLGAMELGNRFPPSELVSSVSAMTSTTFSRDIGETAKMYEEKLRNREPRIIDAAQVYSAAAASLPHLTTNYRILLGEDVFGSLDEEHRSSMIVRHANVLSEEQREDLYVRFSTDEQSGPELQKTTLASVSDSALVAELVSRAGPEVYVRQFGALLDENQRSDEGVRLLSTDTNASRASIRILDAERSWPVEVREAHHLNGVMSLYEDGGVQASDAFFGVCDAAKRASRMDEPGVVGGFYRLMDRLRPDAANGGDDR